MYYPAKSYVFSSNTAILSIYLKVLLACSVLLLISSGVAEASVPFSPGMPIPASGTKQYGTIRGNASGVANVFGKGSYDLFVGLRKLYPFEHFDCDNVPVYGCAISVRSRYSNGYVFQYDSSVYALTSSGNKVCLLKFNKERLEFELSAANVLTGLGSDITGFVGQDGKLHVFYTRGNSSKYYPNNSHDISYHPFNGSGFWRGGIPIDKVFYARWNSLKMDELECNMAIGNDDPEYQLKFGCSGMAIVSYGKDDLQNRLIATNKLGVFRSYINSSSIGMSFCGVGYAVDDTDAKVILRHPIYNPKPIAFPNPVNGLSDLIVSDSGRMWHYQFKGIYKDDFPVYGQKKLVHAAGEDLRLGALPVISPGDIDHDGLIDFIAGNDAGELLFIKNVGTGETPEYSYPVEILVGGEQYRERGGYRGSIQGPGEANWGYTCPTLYDWNMDGKLDIVMNSINANIVVLLQEDGKQDPPKFQKPLTIFNDSLDLHLSWRTQPGITTWGSMTEPCLIANDENNKLRMYFRIDNQNVRQGPVLKLNTGHEIRAHDKRFGGQFGRTKIVPTDWDYDGIIDLIIGTGRAMSIPGPGGIPDNLKGNERQASVLFLRNSGTNKKPEFDYPVRLSFNELAIRHGVHSCSPAVVDFNNNKHDLFVAEESGRIFYYPGKKLSWVDLD